MRASRVEHAAVRVRDLADSVAAIQTRIGQLAAIRATRSWEPGEHEEYLKLRTRRSLLIRRYTAAERSFDVARQRSWARDEGA